MRRLKLAEFQTESNVSLSPDECDGIRRLYPGMDVEPSIGRPGSYNLTPDQRVGIVSLPTLVLEIRPKIPLSSVLFLVSYACDAVRLLNQIAELADDHNLVELLGVMLARMIQDATRRGLLNGYLSEEESVKAPRGRVLFDEQLRRHQRTTTPIEVRHDVYTSDVLENRLLLAALAFVGRMPAQSSIFRRELFRAQGLLGAVSRRWFHPLQVPSVVFTRLNRHYRPALSLATLILRSGSLDLGDRGSDGCAFLIDMNKAFEVFVRRAIRSALGVGVATFPDVAPLTYLDQDKELQLRPDLCLIDRHQTVRWVGDVKYKRLQQSVASADLYQLLAYTIGYDLPEGTLIYAADRTAAAREYIVRHHQKTLRVVVLDLSVPPRDLLGSLGRIATRISMSRS